MSDNFSFDSEAWDATVARAQDLAHDAITSATWCHIFPNVPRLIVPPLFEDSGRIARKVRGRKMTAWDQLYDEFAAAWQFGEYFGENLNALDDCMRNLDEQLPTTAGYVVVVTDAEQVLGASVDDLRDLVASFEMYAEDYAEPIEGPEWDLTARPALGFDVVLVTDAEHRDVVLETWRAAGAPL